jgi:hypothetical protein
MATRSPLRMRAPVGGRKGGRGREGGKVEENKEGTYTWRGTTLATGLRRRRLFTASFHPPPSERAHRIPSHSGRHTLE